jgi:hypothetical protein
MGYCSRAGHERAETSIEKGSMRIGKIFDRRMGRIFGCVPVRGFVMLIIMEKR